MNQSQNDVLKASTLQEQVTLGRHAEAAYHTYLKRFIDEQKASIYEAFLQCSIEEPERLIELKRLSMVYASLEIAIQNDISTGKMAQIELESRLNR